jgi:hypothetical protein
MGITIRGTILHATERANAKRFAAKGKGAVVMSRKAVD